MADLHLDDELRAEARELPRIRVPGPIVDALRELSDATGAPVTWHRRKAYEEYVARHRKVAS